MSDLIEYLSVPLKNDNPALLGKLCSIANCFVFACLSRYHTNPFTRQDMHKKPFITSFNIIFEGCLYSMCGMIISGIYQPFSAIIFNGILSFANYQMFLTM